MVLTFAELQQACRVRSEEAFAGMCEDWTLGDWGNAFGGEAGEAQNLIKKMRRGEEILPTEIGRELADTVIYAIMIADLLGLDLGEEIIWKFNQVSARVNYTGVLSSEGIFKPPK